MLRVLWICVAFLSLIMIVVAARRMLHLCSPGVELDFAFVQHPLLTLTHIVPGLAFVIVGPFQFLAGLRKRIPVCTDGQDVSS